MKAVLAPIFFAIVCIALPAHADDRALAIEHFQKGSSAFDLGNYDEAIAEYGAAYKLKNDSALLYNIAQAHRLAGHSSEALRFYKIYLVKRPNASNRDEVLAKIEELQKLVEHQQRTQDLPPQTVKQVEETNHPEAAKEPAAAGAQTTPAGEAVSPGASSPDRNAGRTKKIAGLTVAAGGVAALASGIALAVMAKKASDDLTTTANNGGFWNQQEANSGKTYDSAGLALIGVGAVAAVAGGVVAILGIREARKAARTVAVSPTVGSNLAAMQLRLSF
jgi:tetratricopeptide (TPR) repeat protein